MWRRMFKAERVCREQVRWVIGNGDVDFWHDSWVLNIPLVEFCNPGAASPSLKVNELWLGQQWNEELLWSMAEDTGLAEEIVEKILQVTFDERVRDKGRWKLTGNGEFTLVSAWNLIRNRGERRLIHELIWSKCIGPSISMFLWRLLANRIPVDAKMQWRGIALASKCRCCEKSQVEKRLHLFVNGEAARRVWLHFAGWFPRVPAFGEVGENLELRFRWWQRHLGARSSQHLSVIIPGLILWFIWSERNENVHREKGFEVENVIKRVNMKLRDLVIAKMIGPDQWKGCQVRLDVMHSLAPGVRGRKVGRVQWRPPDPLWVKINIDGVFRQATQCAGGGGVLRDSEGEIIAAFAASFEAGSSLEAEVMAILIGVTLAKQYGNNIWIESDAESVVRWLETEQLGPAEVCIDLSRIRRELDGWKWKISHIFREGNKAADFLAGMDIQPRSRIFYTRSTTPPRVKALCRLDQIGMPNFRF